MARCFCERLKDPVWGIEERRVLTKLCSLYIASSLERRLGDLYAGGYASSDSKMDILLRDGIIGQCKELLVDAVSLADVIAPPDFIMNSALGLADGQVGKKFDSFKELHRLCSIFVKNNLIDLCIIGFTSFYRYTKILKNGF